MGVRFSPPLPFRIFTLTFIVRVFYLIIYEYVILYKTINTGGYMGRIYQNKNQIFLQELIKIYQPNGFDWLSYQITKKNILTLHHIIKEADGGQLRIDNSALLTKNSHQKLHTCEHKDIILYSEINDFFREIVSHGAPLDDDLIKESQEYKKALTKTLYK